MSDRVAPPDCKRDLDVLILGAGPAGSALALALKRAGIGNVLLIGHPSRRPFHIGESAAPGLGNLLRRLGLDDRLEGRGHRPCYGNRTVWGRTEAAIEDFMSHAHGPGWHLDREAFDSWLRAEALAAGAEQLSPARLETAHRESDEWRVEIRAADEVLMARSRWIVDSTGRPAAFARRSGARLCRFDRLIALAAFGLPATDRGFDGFSLIESAEGGWWYGARLPDGRAVVTFMTDADLASSADLYSPDAFRNAWAASAEISRFAPPPCQGWKPMVFAAGTQFIDRAIGPGWLALGDALMALDPLSAAGISGALEDAIAAADTIVQLLKEPSQGTARALRRAYAARADASLRRYMVERRAIYGRERRWPESRFWQRRALSYEAQTARPASNPS
jgi:flavin-dependent dehydrogenase